MGFWSAFTDVVTDAVSSEHLGDVVTGAAIGAGVAWMTDENPWAGAAIGGAAGGFSSGTSYDISDFLFGSEEAAAQPATDKIAGAAVKAAGGKPVQAQQQGGGLVGSLGRYLKTDSGGKVGAAAISGVGGYMVKQEEAKQKAAQKEKEMRLEKKLRQIEISKGRSPWASKK